MMYNENEYVLSRHFHLISFGKSMSTFRYLKNLNNRGPPHSQRKIICLVITH